MLFYLVAGEDDTLVAGKVLQNGKFLCGKLDGDTSAGNAAGIAVYNRVGDAVQLSVRSPSRRSMTRMRASSSSKEKGFVK